MNGRLMTAMMPAMATAMTLLIAGSAQSNQFGNRGYDGADGWNGRDGRSGQDVTTTVTGDALSLDLDGEHAENGQDARWGEDATSCYQGRPNYDLEGARGGNGGNGGYGGRGGNGGDLTIYSADLKYLNRVFVSSVPGRGGLPGRAGDGGRPCYCRDRNWTNKICRIEKDKNGKDVEVCRNQSFSCRDGVRGYYGSQPSSGSNGAYGSLVVIPRGEALMPTQPAKRISILDLASGPFTLSKNIWLDKSGARSLFAAGSRIRDGYTFWSHRQEYKVMLDWKVDRPLSDFSEYSFGLRVLSDSGPVGVDFPNEIWEAQESSKDGDLQKTRITKAIKENETQQLEATFQGVEERFALLLTDKASVSHLLNTGFILKLEKKRLVDHKTLFEGEVPSSAVDASGNKFLIHLGMLPGVKGKDLKAGDKVKINFTVQRSLGSKSNARLYEDVKYEIPK